MDEISYDKKPWSEWHGCYLWDIQYWPNYGFVCPSAVTTNGHASEIRQFLSEEDVIDFDAWIQEVKNRFTEK